MRDRTAKDGRLVFQRTPDERQVMFMASWHQQNMRLAAELLGRHQGSVDKILWDVAVDCAVTQNCWYKRYYTAINGKRRYVLHEAFFPNQVVGLNCGVPSNISDDDFLQLMRLAGRFKGISPWGAGDYGRFDVETITPRRGPAKYHDDREKQSEVSSVSEPINNG